MKRLFSSIIIPAMVIIGVAVGWAASSWSRGGDPAEQMPALDEKAVSTKDRPPNPGTSIASLSPRLEPVLPELSRWEDCRHFLESLAASRHDRPPAIARAEKNYALRRWLELDAESALSEAERRLEGNFGTDLFRVWLDLNAASALAAFSQASPALTKKARDAFFMALADKDPALAVRELEKPRWKSNEPWDFALKAAYEKWAFIDPAAAADQAGRSDPGFGVGVARAWTAMDPLAAWRYYKSGQRDSKLNLTNLETLAAVFSAAAGMESPDAKQVVEEILPLFKNKDPNRLDYELGTLARTLADQDPLAALEWARTQPPDDALRKEVLTHSARKLATSDPEQALALLTETGGSSQTYENDGILREAFASLSASDPARALTLLNALPEKQRWAAMSGWLTHGFSANPAAAMEQTRAWLADPAMKQSAMSGWANAFSWGHGSGIRDPGPSLEAMPELNSAVTGYVLSTWAKGDPEAAAGWIGARTRDSRLLNLMKDEGVLAEIAMSRPEFTAEWINRLPASPIQEDVVRTLAANWNAFDPEATHAWIDTLPAGLLQEAATQAIAPADSAGKK